MTIAIVDFGLGNLRSVTNAFAHLGADAQLTEDPAVVAQAEAVVLPGDGAFGDSMAGLKQRGLIEPLRAYAQTGRPLLGICVGLQLFFESSEENPGVEGLGLLPGVVKKFQGAAFGAAGGLKVPHMGWNRLDVSAPAHPLFKDVPAGSYVYFIHSYHVAPADEAHGIAWSEYGHRFCAVAGRGSLLGTQFHPEKCQKVGLQMLTNFLEMVKQA